VVTGLSYGDRGTAFLFGGLVEPKMFELFGGSGFILALRVLPQILYVSALIGVLYHLGVMQALARGLGAGLRRILGTSPIESFSAVITMGCIGGIVAVARAGPAHRASLVGRTVPADAGVRPARNPGAGGVLRWMSAT
jgi:CNT family concentrative nucleoside transporter